MAELRNELERASLMDFAVAVRSSATGEDGSDHSFAGIHESFLNVRGTDGIANAIVRCFASLWTPHAVAYRRELGIDDKNVRGAVLICEMVSGLKSNEPIAAGIVFTADPADGRRDTIVIETTEGLGDKLVDGKVVPITTRVRLQLDGYNYLGDYSAPLPQEKMTDLVSLASRIQWAFSDGEVPQDIEWAYDGERIIILQARPVTSIKPRIYPELENQPAIWTNVNFKEVLSGLMSPLG